MAAKKKSTAKAAKTAAANDAKKAATKAQVLSGIAERTGLSKKDVDSVFEALSSMIQKDLKKTGPGVFSVPGLMKIKVVRKPPTKSRKGVNPFTGEEMVIKAKPARNVVKVQPLKNLKSMV
jgi:nucleoid DNA-binding protein